MEYLEGFVYTEDGFRRGYAVVDGGSVETELGRCPGTPSARGVIIPLLVNGHTHCADADVHPPPGMRLEELVAPPDGLKHKYLRETSPEKLERGMSEYGKASRRNGIRRFVDFREGGAEGCRMLRRACHDAVILGRPLSPSFDPSETDDLLSVADGIALPSISDIDRDYAERVAGAAHGAGKPFAIHASERVRENIDEVLSLEPAFVVHMVQATDADMKRCADEDVPIVVCARSNRYFGMIPPIKRMLDAGCTVALGTDNAMLGSPDMRPEALAFSAVLKGQGGKDSQAWDCLIGGAKKLLNEKIKIGVSTEEADGIAVLPCPGNVPESALMGEGDVYVPHEKERLE